VSGVARKHPWPEGDRLHGNCSDRKEQCNNLVMVGLGGLENHRPRPYQGLLAVVLVNRKVIPVVMEHWMRPTDWTEEDWAAVPR
jgi:hypothetical protein